MTQWLGHFIFIDIWWMGWWIIHYAVTTPHLSASRIVTIHYSESEWIWPNSESLLAPALYQICHDTVIEVPYPRMVSIFSPKIFNVFDIIHIWWITGCLILHHAVATSLVNCWHSKNYWTGMGNQPHRAKEPQQFTRWSCSCPNPK
jgi:hypothetical protein